MTNQYNNTNYMFFNHKLNNLGEKPTQLLALFWKKTTKPVNYPGSINGTIAK